MNSKDFNELVNTTVTKVLNTLTRKGAEYNMEDDRFDHFKHAARISGWQVTDVWMGYTLKHITSLIDMVNSMSEGKDYPMSLWEEKVGDIINYLILLIGIIQEKQETSKKDKE